MELHRDMKRLTAIFEKLHTYVSLLALPSKCQLGLSCFEARRNWSQIFRVNVFINDRVLTFFSFFMVLLGTKPEGLLRTNYSLVFTNIAASIHASHDILKGKATWKICFGTKCVFSGSLSSLFNYGFWDRAHLNMSLCSPFCDTMSVLIMNNHLLQSMEQLRVPRLNIYSTQGGQKYSNFSVTG